MISNIYAKSLQWGISNEPVARKKYLETFKSHHKKLKIIEKGFFISIDNPFIGASPDGVISCDCHGECLLEIKCPWTHRGLSIDEYTKQKDVCLERKDNQVQLKKSHAYYYQVQCQMAVTGIFKCEFYLCTTKESHLELINFDEEFWKVNLAKTKIFYDNIIIPELMKQHENIS